MKIPASFLRRANRHFLLTAVAAVFLAQERPGMAQNVIVNGGFEEATTPESLLWDGVDNDGYIAGNRGSVLAIGSTGTKKIPMPMSVAFADINGDGLPDLITADPVGILRAYINSGTKTEPKFTNCEIIPLFLTGGELDQRRAPKINLYDWGKRGMLDLVVGNYAGEVLFLPNSGSASSPDFRQPDDASKLVLSTSGGDRLWGNLFAPVAYDWNKDGKPDLIIGEGGYSSNAVHLLLNKSSSSRPEFSEDSRYYLAYGDGREHLVPTVADFNGDGNPDLLVADRDGKVGVYLNPGASWKPGEEFVFSQFVHFGNMESLGGPVTILAADYNGDGLFDLLIGRDNGRVAVAINKGTKEQPKFDSPLDIRGTPLGTPLHAPSGWSIGEGIWKANFYGYISVVDAAEDPNAAPPEGKHVLKAGYLESPNKVFKKPSFVHPGDKTYYAHPFFNDVSAHTTHTPGNYFLIRTLRMPALNVGSAYTLSFKVKGRAVQEAQYTLAWSGYKAGTPAKIQHGERGSATVTGGNISESPSDRGAINVTGNWTTVTKTVVISFTNPDLKDLKQTVPILSPGADGNYSKLSASLEFRIALVPNQGVFYLDDVKLVEKK